MLSWFVLLATASLCSRGSKNRVTAIVRETIQNFRADSLHYMSQYRDCKVLCDELCPIDSLEDYQLIGDAYLKFRWTRTQAYIKADLVATNLKRSMYDQARDLGLLYELEEDPEGMSDARLNETITAVGARSILRSLRLSSFNDILVSRMTDSEILQWDLNDQHPD